MRLIIASVGKIPRGPYRELADEYHGRLKHYRPLDLLDIRQTDSATEGAALLDATPSGALVVALDERGKHWTSEELAAWLDRKMVEGTRHIAFLIGGPDGHGPAVRDSADLTLALSKFTMPHDLARVVLAEQLYRAFTIVRGEPYHR